MTTITRGVATEGQIRQINRVATDAAEKAVTDYFQGRIIAKEGAQRVLKSPDFAARIRKAIAHALADISTTSKYKDEELISTYSYMSGYRPRSVVDQCNRLHELFSTYGYPSQDLFAQIENGEILLPGGAEGWFAIPNVWGNPDMLILFGGSDCAAVQKVLDMIKTTRNVKFANYIDDKLNPEHFRQSQKTVDFFVELSKLQGDPSILLVPAQFGIKHRGRSVRRACEAFELNEVGLGTFAIGIMLLTHPDRLKSGDDLWIDCAGDQFAPDDRGIFSGVPLFYSDGEKVKLIYNLYYSATEYSGSASAFGPL